MAAQSSITAYASHEDADAPIDVVGALLANAMLAAVPRRPQRGGEAVEPRVLPGKPAPSCAARLALVD